MKILKRVVLVVLILLGITAGAAKIMQMPQEMEFFQDAGFSETQIILFSVAQLAAGILLVFQKMRMSGAIIMAVTLGISTVLIFVSGKIAFGFFSVLPILMAGIIIKDSAKFTHNKSLQSDASKAGAAE